MFYGIEGYLFFPQLHVLTKFGSKLSVLAFIGTIWSHFGHFLNIIKSTLKQKTNYYPKKRE